MKNRRVFTIAASVLLLAGGCTSNAAVVLTCRETAKRIGEPVTWILQIDASGKTAEMVVHVPSDSIASGVPPGNRKGSVYASERQYEVLIPLDEGGTGAEKWFRPTFAFDIDRFTGTGNVFVGGKTPEASPMAIRCEPASTKPLF